MLEQIEEMLHAPTTGADAPTRARMDATLTEGYARALALEAEGLRLERRIGEIARVVDGSDFSAFAEELSSLGRRLAAADGELVTLRGRLAALQQRARNTRVGPQTMPERTA
jgi:hypothetical protein